MRARSSSGPCAIRRRPTSSSPSRNRNRKTRCAEEDRIIFLHKLGTSEIDKSSIPRWQKFARDSNQQVREKALEILATQAPESSVELFVEQLPLASYAIQQMIVGALTRAAV